MYVLLTASRRSRQAIKKYVKSNNDLGNTTDAAFDKHINQALASGEKAGEFNRPKGPSGPVKLAKKDAAPKPAATTTKKPAAKPAAESTTSKSTTAKVRAGHVSRVTTLLTPAQKTSTTKKPAAAPKKTSTTKSKTTTKANTAKKAAPKKTAAVRYSLSGSIIRADHINLAGPSGARQAHRVDQDQEWPRRKDHQARDSQEDRDEEDCNKEGHS